MYILKKWKKEKKTTKGLNDGIFIGRIIYYMSYSPWKRISGR